VRRPRIPSRLRCTRRKRDAKGPHRARVAFENKDGSFTFKLDILPQTKFQLREEKPLAKEEAAAE